MTVYKAITSQAQYDSYLKQRKSLEGSYSVLSIKSYNELTIHIVNWNIKCDPAIKTEPGKLLNHADIVPPKTPIQKASKRLVKKSQKHKENK